MMHLVIAEECVELWDVTIAKIDTCVLVCIYIYIYIFIYFFFFFLGGMSSTGIWLHFISNWEDFDHKANQFN